MYKKVEEYNPFTNEWTRRTDMPVKIGELSTVALVRKIYLIGGSTTLHPFTSTNSVYEYDPHKDLLSLVENVALNQSYAIPGTDSVIITTKTKDPTGINLLAKIESPDQTVVDSLHLLDDGNHNDGVAGDSLFANFWPVLPVDERNYWVDLEITQIDTDTVINHLNNGAVFTTIGPIVFEKFTFIYSDTLFHPGDQIPIRLFLKNEGSSTTASNVTASLTIVDTCANIYVTQNPKYGDIAPGESAHTAGGYGIKIHNNCAGSVRIPMKIDIASNNFTFWSDTFSVFINPEGTGVIESKKKTPSKFTLHQNYPNPFNPVTTIRYALPNACKVILNIYNFLGQEVAKLIDENKLAGKYEVQWNASKLPSGVYVARLQAGDYVTTRKLVLLK
jgi:hypothetical protein